MGITTILWLAATVVFGIVEGATTALVSVWFAIGAAAAALVSVCTGSIGLQLVVFALVSAVTFAISLPLLSAHRQKKAAPVTNGSPLTIGKCGIVLRAINPGEVGRVRVDGLDWQAVSTVAIAQDTKIVVVGVDGANLVVSAAVDKATV